MTRRFSELDWSHFEKGGGNLFFLGLGLFGPARDGSNFFYAHSGTRFLSLS